MGHSPSPSPHYRDYARSARRALALRDFALAWEQAAAACALDPHSDSNTALFEQLMTVDPNPLRHLAIHDGVFFGIAAMRARVLGRSGDFQDAFDLLADTMLHQPERPYLKWAAAWKVLADDLLRFGNSYLSLILDNRSLSRGASKNLQTLLTMLSAVEIADGANRENLTLLEIRTLRCLGENERALTRAEKLRDSDSWDGQVEYAICLRKLDRLGEAASAFARAKMIRPEELSAYLDYGDTLLLDGDFETAAVAFGEVLEKWPENDWALSSREYVLSLSGDFDAPQRLLAAHHESTNSRRHCLAQHWGIYRHALPVIFDPIVPILKRALVDISKSSEDVISLQLGVETAIALSAKLGFQRGLQQLEKVVNFSRPSKSSEATRVVEERPEKKHLETTSINAAVIERIAELARSPIEPLRWLAHAAAINCELSTEERVRLPALMTAPPSDAHHHPLDWVFRFQVATAVVIVSAFEHQSTSDQLSRLRELVLCGNDWSAGAHAIALTWATKERKFPADRLTEWLRLKLAQNANESASPNEHVYLVCLGSLLPAGAERSELWRRRLEFEKRHRLLRP